ncbi:unnamed protein product, partial [Rotaria sp. Silwood2]
SFLDDFLNEETIEGMTISAILELTKFLLNHQYFISEQRQVLKTNQELAKKKQRFRLSYLYEFGSKHKFNKELQGILSQYLNPKDQYSNHKKIKFILTTKSQHSLNALLSEQKPTHDLLNKNTTMF